MINQCKEISQNGIKLPASRIALRASLTHYSLLIILFVSSGARAGQTAAKVTFPGIRVFPASKRVEVDAKLSLNDGIIEFLMVQKAGKDYESLLVTDAKASHLNVALGLIGLKKREVELTKDGMVKSVPGYALIDGAVSIQIKWNSKGKKTTSTVEDLMIRRTTKKTPPAAPWIFTGSRIRDIEGAGKVFGGDYEKVSVGVWYDRSAILNYSVRSRNPYWGDDAGFMVNKDDSPPPGTKVTVIITPWKNEDGK
ncbi:MAG: YdjY domain-containing protein [Planctomycetota bacterium]|nr:YdjY domain-containing protein [Planctomycetota bacterium]